jgi:predicted transposase/invertase (TIGR01784 family)
MAYKILQPKLDYVFKLIFGDSRNIDILEAFLKAALDIPVDEYDGLAIADPHLKLETAVEKMGILDVKVHTKSGLVIDVEIQLSSTPELRNRIVLYDTKMLTEQLKRGESWNRAKRVISIIIMNDILVPEEEKYYNRYGLYNRESGRQFTNLVEINILELPKLPQSDNGERLWIWGQFLRSEKEEEFKMVAEKDPGVKKAVAVLMELSEDEQTQIMAEKRWIWLMDQHNREMHQYNKGIEKGREEGREDLEKAQKENEALRRENEALRAKNG